MRARATDEAGQSPSGILRLRPVWSARPVPMHSRQTTHLAPPGAPEVDGTQPTPSHVVHWSFASILRSLWPIA
jgi:hypothetical protein